jgi:dTDP-4-dehydrorhamnose reductase
VTRILVIGESGQLARCLDGLRWPAGFDLAFIGRRQLPDGTPAAGIRTALEGEKPALVLNTAAYTAVDRAESEPAAAAALNAALPRVLAETCDALDIPLVHVSTDYVFDGEKGAPYLETDAPNPLSVYGATKLEGDVAIQRAGLRRWAILRASWVVSEIGETFPVKVLRRARTEAELRVVDDQVGCPTSAHALARAMQSVGLRLLDGDEASRGLFNYCGAEAMSWFDFAERLLKEAARHGLRVPPLHRIGGAQLAAPARRPANSALSCAKIAAQCRIEPERCGPAIERMVPAILAAAAG